MIKLIAFDIDGTLAAKKHMVSEKNREAIRIARESGIKIALATGRSMAGMESVANQIDIKENQDYLVGYNGAVVFQYGENGKECKIAKSTTFTPPQVNKIFMLAKQYKVAAFANIKERDYALVSKRRGFFVWWMKRRNHAKIELFNDVKHRNDEVYKFVIYGKKKHIEAFRVEMVKLNFETFAFSYISNSQNLEVTATGVNKAYGLSELAKIYHIQKEEIMFFGDGENDIAALDYAGVGVAMENAKDHIKEHADFVAPHHLKDGVADTIAKYLEAQKIDSM